jgi:hypothetical protein
MAMPGIDIHKSTPKMFRGLRDKALPDRGKRPRHLRFYLYTVEGAHGQKQRTFRVVCCHASDARIMVLERLPDIGDLRVKRGKAVHFIAIGEHPLHE